ncbi:MAG: hypothetical protein ACE5OY_06350 [Candidatus Bathyarchaeia archaeon]
MARRKRRKVAKPLRKRLPQVFQCPVCGKNSLSVRVGKSEGAKVAAISCGSCGINDSVEILPVQTIVDAYCAFTDKFLRRVG